MEGHLNDFFKGKSLTISSVLSASVMLAEKVNSDTSLSGLQKTEAVVNALKEYLKDTPELIALVEGVVPEMLRLAISSARGELNLKAVKKWCVPFTVPSCTRATTAEAVAIATAVTASPGSWRRFISCFTRPAEPKVDLTNISAVKAIDSPAEELKPKLEVRETVAKA